MNKKLEKIKTVTVYCGSHTPNDEKYIDATISLAKFMAEHNMTLVYGGSNSGLMKVLADTMLENGAKVIGIFTENLCEEQLHPDLTESFTVKNLSCRKAEMIARADAIIALPGSFGTWDELFDALALRKVKRNGHKKPVGVLNINGYFDDLLSFIEKSIACGFTSSRHGQLLKAAKTPEDLFKQLAGSVVES